MSAKVQSAIVQNSAMEMKTKILYKTIKEMAKEDKYITIRKLKKKLGWNRLTIEKHLAYLLGKGLVRRVKVGTAYIIEVVRK